MTPRRFAARLAGWYTVGDGLPTAGEPARRFDVDPDTARAVHARLGAEGPAGGTRGKGIFVKADLRQRRSGRLGGPVRNAIREARPPDPSTEELATVIRLRKRFAAGRPRSAVEAWPGR